MPPADRPWGARGSQGAQRDPAKPAVPPLGFASQSPEDDDRKVRRREKNRVAAQRSRKKQTQKADKLHEGHFIFQDGCWSSTHQVQLRGQQQDKGEEKKKGICLSLLQRLSKDPFNYVSLITILSYGHISLQGGLGDKIF
ncbi:basic leucine zipper transcriptional factor ATF-like 3 isoform X1 [Felis catus]|uniref:basic leucine zipper transcriptional factor ATF-like 3 isoform X1 n=1 Tax=Felis catus TaxID=9685 RepID=UPI001D19C1DA|nr:basic leucine zipper transcriptional factor ATF-like 3 isoform X1 [Felis catus]